jgi:hypothetical protein
MGVCWARSRSVLRVSSGKTEQKMEALAGWKPAKQQIGNLRYNARVFHRREAGPGLWGFVGTVAKRLASEFWKNRAENGSTGRLEACETADWKSALQNLRYNVPGRRLRKGRLEICATKSALRRAGVTPARVRGFPNHPAIWAEQVFPAPRAKVCLRERHGAGPPAALAPAE